MTLFLPSLTQTRLDDRPFVTGNWGAGVFLGNAHLKFLIQCMAAAVAQRRLIYKTWEDQELATQLQKLRETLSGKEEVCFVFSFR